MDFFCIVKLSSQTASDWVRNLLCVQSYLQRISKVRVKKRNTIVFILVPSTNWKYSSPLVSNKRFHYNHTRLQFAHTHKYETSLLKHTSKRLLIAPEHTAGDF